MKPYFEVGKLYKHYQKLDRAVLVLANHRKRHGFETVAVLTPDGLIYQSATLTTSNWILVQ